MAIWLRHTLLALAGLACGCQPLSVEFGDRPERQSTLGEMAHGIALANAARADSCSAEYQSLLTTERALMVEGIDETLAEEIIADLPTLMRQSVLPIYDQGALEAFTNALGDALRPLIAEEDPSREALHGISELLHTQTIVQDDHLLELGRALSGDPRLTDGLSSLAGLTQLPVRDGDALDSLLYVAGRALAKDEESSACVGLSEQLSAAHLLSTEDFEDTPVLGNTVPVARVDAAGLPISELYDVKRTALAHVLRIAGEAVAAGVLSDLGLVLDASLGSAIPCADAQSPNCYHYQRLDSPVHEILFALLEVARFPRSAELVDTWSKLVDDNPELAEQILVSLGAMVTAVDDSNLDLGGAALYELVEKILPLVADIFQINTSSGTTMPRLLMDVVHELSGTAREFPDKLVISIDHTTLNKSNACSAEPPDASSPAVDFSRRRYYFAAGQQVDNRSTLEQSIELLADAHCGTVPLTGGMSVGETIVDLMSRLAPETVCNLIGDLLGLLGVTGNIGEAVVNAALTLVGCGSDELRAADLFALDDLAKSGALDFYLPIAKSFRQEDQLPALLSIFVLARDDLRADEDADANSSSALRPLLPILADLLRAGVMDPFFDLNDLMVSVEAVDGDGSLADVVIDSGAQLLEDRGSINTASGIKTNRSLAEELVSAIKGISEGVDAANQGEALSRLFDFASAFLTETYIDDQGTADPGDDITHLEDASLVPLLGSLLRTAGEAARLPAPQYQCYLDQWQGESGEWIESPALAAFVGVAEALHSYDRRAQLEALLEGLLAPERDDTTAPPYDELIRVSAEILQSPIEIAGLDAIADYLSAVLYPSPNGKVLVTVLSDLLQEDSTRVLQRLIAGGLGPMGTPAEDAPFYKLGRLAEHYDAIDASNLCLPTTAVVDEVAALEDSVTSLVSLLQDDDSVLAGVYQLLRKRSGP